LEPTSGGGVFLIIIIVVAFAAWNTGNNLLFLVFSLLCSTLFVGWMAARASLRDLNVSARFPDHIFAGEPAPVIVTLRNTKHVLPSFSIFVEARGPKPDSTKLKRGKRYAKRLLAYFSYVPHRASAEQRVEQLFPTRGHVLIDGFELSTRFPFGFFRRRRRLRARNVDIVVYPKPEIISDELHLLPMYAGRLPSLRRGQAMTCSLCVIINLRMIYDTSTGRPLPDRPVNCSRVHSEDERRITIVLDTRLPRNADDDLRSRFERGVVQTASLLKHFIDESAEVRLVLAEEIGAFGSGIEHLYRCLRRLAVVSPLGENAELAATNIEVTVRTSLSRETVEHDYAILLTAASPGSIPANVWRTSHVIYL
jgi:uncharacterized protein (DUF58 family)